MPHCVELVVSGEMIKLAGTSIEECNMLDVVCVFRTGTWGHRAPRWVLIDADYMPMLLRTEPRERSRFQNATGGDGCDVAIGTLWLVWRNHTSHQYPTQGMPFQRRRKLIPGACWTEEIYFLGSSLPFLSRFLPIRIIAAATPKRSLPWWICPCGHSHLQRGRSRFTLAS